MTKMEVKILKDEKNNIEIELSNLTIAEVIREYLHQDSSVEFAAWRRDHPSKPIILKVETKGKTAKKAIEDAINLIIKEADSLVSIVKKI